MTTRTKWIVGAGAGVLALVGLIVILKRRRQAGNVAISTLNRPMKKKAAVPRAHA